MKSALAAALLATIALAACEDKNEIQTLKTQETPETQQIAQQEAPQETEQAVEQEAPKEPYDAMLHNGPMPELKTWEPLVQEDGDKKILILYFDDPATEKQHLDIKMDGKDDDAPITLTLDDDGIYKGEQITAELLNSDTGTGLKITQNGQTPVIYIPQPLK